MKGLGGASRARPAYFSATATIWKATIFLRSTAPTELRTSNELDCGRTKDLLRNYEATCLRVGPVGFLQRDFSVTRRGRNNLDRLVLFSSNERLFSVVRPPSIISTIRRLLVIADASLRLQRVRADFFAYSFRRSCGRGNSC